MSIYLSDMQHDTTLHHRIILRRHLRNMTSSEVFWLKKIHDSVAVFTEFLPYLQILICGVWTHFMMKSRKFFDDSVEQINVFFDGILDGNGSSIKLLSGRVKVGFYRQEHYHYLLVFCSTAS